MKRLSKTIDTIFTPAFKLNPKKWVDYYLGLVESKKSELNPTELFELVYDADRSIMSVVKHDFYIFEHPISRLDKSYSYKSLLKESGILERADSLHRKCLEMIRAHNKDKFNITREFNTNPKKLPSQDLKRNTDSLMLELNSRYSNIRQEITSDLTQLLQTFKRILSQIPDEQFNISKPEFKERFELKDAHHDYLREPRGVASHTVSLSRLVSFGI